MTELNIGSTLQSGKYEILRVLGQGGFGITYLARHSLLNETFAIKEFFPKDYCNRDGATSHITVATQSNSELVKCLRDRFIKEAQNMVKLKHPGIIQIHDVFEENGTAYYVMDFIEGTSLEDMVRRNGPMPEKTGVEYARRIGEALDYIHSHKITHFDVKPANVMVREKDGEPILIDFGLSKQYNDNGDARSTLLMGVSHGYSPLEQYIEDGIDTFSPQTDVYALGATLYYLLTSRVPPQALKLTAAPIEVPLNISKHTADAIKWAMALHRENRCPSARALIDALDPTKGATHLSAQRAHYEADSNPRTQFVTSQKPTGNNVNNSQESDNRNVGNAGNGGNSGTGNVVSQYRTGNFDAAPRPVAKTSKGHTLKIVALSFLAFIIILLFVILLVPDKSSRQADDGAAETQTTDSIMDDRDGQKTETVASYEVSTAVAEVVEQVEVKPMHGYFGLDEITLEPQAGNRYSVGNLFDENPATAWVIGEKKFNAYCIREGRDMTRSLGLRPVKRCKVTEITIMNGYQKNASSWSNNARVGNIMVVGHKEGSSESSTVLYNGQLKDKKEWQTLRLSSPDYYDFYTLEFQDIYPGKKWNDLCISEMRFWGEN